MYCLVGIDSEVHMRHLLIVIGIIVAIIGIGVVVFGATFNVNRYRSTIQTELEQRLVRQVTLGEMHLNLFPPRFIVQNLAIADDPTSAQKNRSCRHNSWTCR